MPQLVGEAGRDAVAVTLAGFGADHRFLSRAMNVPGRCLFHRPGSFYAAKP
jgi:hypothetical protein